VGRLGDIGWAIRDRLSGTAVAVVLALAGLGAGAAGIVIALDAKDKAEDSAGSTAPVSVPTTPPDAVSGAEIDELNERVAAIEKSVAKLRAESTTTAPLETGETTTPKPPTVPETPELPEGIEVPGVPAPDGASPERP
jgi:hypothetical protein